MTTRRNRHMVRTAIGALLVTVAAAACAPDTPPATTTTTSTTATTVPVYTPAVTFSATTDLAQTGSTVTINGEGFDPALINASVPGVYVAIGIGDGAVPTAYTSAKYIRPNGPDPETTSGAKLQTDGTFSATISTPALFAGQGQAVNCYLDACKVFVWSAHTGSLSSWSFSAPLTFAAATTKQVVVSKASNLSRDGETVTVTGAGFAATSPGIYLGQVPWSEATAPAGWNLDSAAWGPTKFLSYPSGLSAAGTFRTTIDAEAVIGTSATDCGVSACSIATVKAHGQPDPTGALTSWTSISFAAPAA